MKLVSERRTIPASLEEWLRGFQSGPEQHAWPKEIRDDRHGDGEAGPGPGGAKELTDGLDCDNVQVSIGI